MRKVPFDSIINNNKVFSVLQLLNQPNAFAVLLKDSETLKVIKECLFMVNNINSNSNSNSKQ
jgi:hypothetical protein